MYFDAISGSMRDQYRQQLLRLLGREPFGVTRNLDQMVQPEFDEELQARLIGSTAAQIQQQAALAAGPRQYTPGPIDIAKFTQAITKVK